MHQEGGQFHRDGVGGGVPPIHHQASSQLTHRVRGLLPLGRVHGTKLPRNGCRTTVGVRQRSPVDLVRFPGRSHEQRPYPRPASEPVRNGVPLTASVQGPSGLAAVAKETLSPGQPLPSKEPHPLRMGQDADHDCCVAYRHARRDLAPGRRRPSGSAVCDRLRTGPPEDGAHRREQGHRPCCDTPPSAATRSPASLSWTTPAICSGRRPHARLRQVRWYPRQPVTHTTRDTSDGRRRLLNGVVPAGLAETGRPRRNLTLRQWHGWLACAQVNGSGGGPDSG